MQQLSLPFFMSEEGIQAYLAGVACKPVVLTLTDNSTSMVSFRTREGVVHVRLHRMFLQADQAVLEEIGKFILGGRVKIPLTRRFIEVHRRDRPPRQSRRGPCRPGGRTYDLRAIFQEINKTYFNDRVSASITWGNGSSRGRVRRRTLGSYCKQTNMIRINPVLDKKAVPRYVVEHVVHHEMLHADMGVTYLNGRRRLHPPEFRERERLFKAYKKAKAWEK